MKANPTTFTLGITMDPATTHIISHYDQMSDEELIRRCQSGELTEQALIIAEKELQQRCLKIPTPIQKEIAESKPNKRRHILWWVYLFYLLATLVFWFVFVAREFPKNPPQSQLIGIAAMLLDVWAIFGFWGYLRFRPLGFDWLWVICVSLKFAQFVAAILITINNDFFKHNNLLSMDIALFLGGLLLGLPLLIALFRYAFLSQNIWKRLNT